MPPKASTSAAAASGAAVAAPAAAKLTSKSASTSGSTKASGSGSAPTVTKKTTASGTSAGKASSSKPSSSAAAADPGPSGTTTSKKPKPDVKLSSMESSIHRYILNLPDKTLLQPDVIKMVPKVAADDVNHAMTTINAMMRKSLLKVHQTSRGESAYVAMSIQEAREMGAMDPHEKLCLDHIKMGGNQGMWTRRLKSTTGLHQNIINRCLKQLEQKKLVKQVKSVKHTTRKIYMQADLVPSIDVTGGPWYGKDGQLDKEFIDLLVRVAKGFIRNKSFPPKRQDLMWPRAYIPYLPTANDVLEHLNSTDVLRDVELDVEHMEVILNVCVYDGDIERLWCTRHPEDGRHWMPDSPKAEAVNGKKRKKTKASSGAKAKKRARRDSADIDRDSDDDEDEEEEESEEEEEDAAKSEPDEEYRLPEPLTNGNHHFDMDYSMEDDGGKPHKRPGPAGNQAYWVYRTILTGIPSGTFKGPNGEVESIYPDTFELGLTQTPCGICPVAQFCHNRGAPKVLPLPGEKDLDDSGSTGWEEWKTSSSVTARAKTVGTKQATKHEDRIKALLKMKAPSGGGELEDADGKWKGGGKVGGKVIAPVNPTNCRYYSQWFGQEFDW